MKQPKYKNEYRSAIADNAKHIKSATSLRTLYRLSEEFVTSESDARDQNIFYMWAIVYNLTSGKLTDHDIELIYYLADSFVSANKDTAGREG